MNVYLFIIFIFWFNRKAEAGLESMSEIDCGTSEDTRNNRLKLTVSAGLGFGIMSGAFSFIDILSYSLGYGTVGIQGGSQFYFLAAAFLTQIFIFLNLCWTVIVNFAMEHKHYWHLLIVVASHLFCSYSVSYLYYLIYFYSC